MEILLTRYTEGMSQSSVGIYGFCQTKSEFTELRLKNRLGLGIKWHLTKA